jgi:lipopolysaccharide/colanic/teichoic acid biosynthesis glycosyltransferase
MKIDRMKLFKSFKRIVDVIISFCLLFLLSPIFITIVLFLYFNGYKRIFFRQRRPGQHEKIFKIIKFRTMQDLVDEKGVDLPDAFRMTKLGNFLRQSSLDEIPQLFNVLRGDMSIVGPRPLLPEYINLYNDRQKKRHEVKPGITGWSQINGRNAINWKQKLELDAWYVEHMGIRLDLKILLRTFFIVFEGKGISQNGQATIKKFTGNFD